METIKQCIRCILYFFSPTKIVKRRKNKVISASDNFGCLYHLGNLLDQMDDYFKSISYLKKKILLLMQYIGELEDKLLKKILGLVSNHI